MHNNNNRNNNNRRFSKNNNFKKRRFGSSGVGSGGGAMHHSEDQQISPQQRRNFENKRDTHLAKAKEYLSAGERIEAENHFQHADHYHRMAIMGLDKIQQQQQLQQQQQQQAQAEQEEYSNAAPEENTSAESDAHAPEIPVDMMGRFPSENNGSNNAAPQRNEGRRGGYQRNNRGRDRVNNAADAAAAPAVNSEAPNELSALPFMQIELKDNPVV